MHQHYKPSTPSSNHKSLWYGTRCIVSREVFLKSKSLIMLACSRISSRSCYIRKIVRKGTDGHYTARNSSLTLSKLFCERAYIILEIVCISLMTLAWSKMGSKARDHIDGIETLDSLARCLLNSSNCDLTSSGTEVKERASCIAFLLLSSSIT